MVVKSSSTAAPPRAEAGPAGDGDTLTAPAWMRTGGTLSGPSGGPPATLSTAAFAAYLAAYARAYADDGVSADLISPLNEPLAPSTNHPTMPLTTQQESAVIAVRGPALRADELSTRIAVSDQNWDFGLLRPAGTRRPRGGAVDRRGRLTLLRRGPLRSGGAAQPGAEPRPVPHRVLQRVLVEGIRRLPALERAEHADRRDAQRRCHGRLLERGARRDRRAQARRLPELPWPGHNRPPYRKREVQPRAPYARPASHDHRSGCRPGGHPLVRTRWAGSTGIPG